MKHKLFFLTVLNLLYFTGFSQTPPKREFRAAWLATYANIDWPSSSSTTAQEQSTFIQRIEEHRVTGMNAVFVQIRSQCDAMYPSPYEPWSADLTGTQGTAPNPYYDPLEFMITETRKKGMEFHAWINPYRALASATSGNLSALHSSHVINQHPDWIMTAGTQKILNPGNPAVWDFVIKVVMDVVRRYDVDGIHFDDYFYPYPSAGIYDDDAEFALYSRGITTKATWRRSNVDTLIKRLGDSIRTVKPWVKFGISPSGIWLSQTGVVPNDPNGSNTSSGATQHYKDLYANSRLWLQQGWIDYLAPQIYWYIGQSGSDYNILIPWWNSNAFGRHIYSGMAGYKVGDAAQNAAFYTDNTQVPTQIRLNRQNTNIKGQIIYNTTSLRNNKLGFRDSLQIFFNKPALQPTMTWKDPIAPLPATLLVANQTSSSTMELTWVKPAIAINELDKVKRFAVYRSTNAIVDIANANNLIAITWNDTTKYVDNTIQNGTTYYYVVTALDRLHNESAASNTTTITTLPLKIVALSLDVSTAKKATINWATNQEINVSHFEIERANNNLQFEFKGRINATNLVGLNNYSFQDDVTKLNGNLYYRIKIIDKDNSSGFSKILSANINSKNELVKVYPTIFTKGTTINFIIHQAAGNNISYRLMDIVGRTMQEGNISSASTQLQLSKQINSGNYYLLLTTEAGTTQQVSLLIY